MAKDLFQVKGWVVNFAKNRAARFHIHAQGDAKVKKIGECC